MTKIEELQLEIASRECSLACYKLALADEIAKLENNIFVNLAEAVAVLEDALIEKAAQDCEGSYNVGDPEYRQKFTILSKTPEAVLDVNYSRHDKRYYYIDDHSLIILNAAGEVVEL